MKAERASRVNRRLREEALHNLSVLNRLRVLAIELWLILAICLGALGSPFFTASVYPVALYGLLSAIFAYWSSRQARFLSLSFYLPALFDMSMVGVIGCFSCPVAPDAAVSGAQYVSVFMLVLQLGVLSLRLDVLAISLVNALFWVTLLGTRVGFGAFVHAANWLVLLISGVILAIFIQRKRRLIDELVKGQRE